MSPVLALVASLISVILDHIPHEQAQQLLSDEAKRRANAAADAVVAARMAADAAVRTF